MYVMRLRYVDASGKPLTFHQSPVRVVKITCVARKHDRGCGQPGYLTGLEKQRVVKAAPSCGTVDMPLCLSRNLLDHGNLGVNNAENRFHVKRGRQAGEQSFSRVQT